ncbi:hypothetical protein DEIPH_ctg013orf0004 [Deinococcus phoenicis]|uniref:Peptidase S24/S26A/S26B/S26C domain-containing protein n=1 Tax=Deinococcus phoenicis TaxID=1476583 RepID=A0A016QSL5_9DEIO|nr:S24 family peptidase [Deinococcus phoenicis]EYB68902.1 hypothetical protein DEIPH_ctg013orf0004 [Deinococcus phoenicis]
MLPVSGIVQASRPDAPVDDYYADLRQVVVTLTASQYRPGARAMLITGDSMDDGTECAIRSGDIVLVDTNITYSIYSPHKITVFETPNGYVAKLRTVLNGKHVLASLNPNVPPIRNMTGYKIVGSVYAKYVGARQVESV